MNGGTLRMSAKERDRMVVLEQVESRGLSLVEASERLRLSYRQTKRIWGRWRREREAGLVHRLRGTPSNRRIPEALKRTVLETYAREYGDFGPTLAAEKLEERQGVRVNRETLRRWLREAHLWIGRRRLRHHRRRRERRAHFGELVQIDGSHHAWFEERAAPCCLMVMTDDATGRMAAHFAPEETTEAAFAALRQWIGRFGVPQALYADRKSVYFVQRPATVQESRRGSGARTDFSRACFRMNIEMIRAHSPQAKGRVERKNGVLQDRLVKELRLRAISDIAEANRFLATYCKSHNERFAVPALSPLDRHRPAPDAATLNDLLCREWERAVGRDWTVALHGQHWQIEPQPELPRPGARLTVRRRADGTLCLLHHGRPLRFTRAQFGNKSVGHPHPLGGGDGIRGHFYRAGMGDISIVR